MAAANIGNLRTALELLLHPFQRWDPLGHEIRPLPGAEEPLSPSEKTVVVLVPAHPFATPERF